jgi:hypothetical protein
MGRMTSKQKRKSKKSFTLSIESVAFLEEMRMKNSAESTSAILEEILQAIRRQEKRSSIERELTEYYDSLTEAEFAEERQWGEFARRGFLAEEHS